MYYIDSIAKKYVSTLKIDVLYTIWHVALIKLNNPVSKFPQNNILMIGNNCTFPIK